jgi:hypothetical protein
MGVLMFRFWAGATASFFVGSLGVSGVLAAEFGSSLAPPSSSPPSAVYFLTDNTSFSSANSAASSWSVTSGAGLVNTTESRTFASVDLAASPSAGSAWSSTSLLENAKSIAASSRSQPRTDSAAYLGVLEALSKPSFAGARSSGAFILPTGNGFGVENNGMSMLRR